MANALQLRRGTTTQHNSFTGLAGEVTVDTDKETVVVHDGSTAGGFPLARASDLTNFDADTLDGKQLATIESEYQAFANTAAANVVDSAPGTLDTLNELAAALGDDANFSTTVTNSIATKMPLAGGTFTGNVNFGDNDKAVFGANDDLEILHDGNSVIRTTVSSAGDLYIQSQKTGQDLYLQSADDVYIRPQNGENGIKVIGDGAVELYHNNSNIFTTTTSGITVNSNLDLSSSGSDAIISNDGGPVYIQSNSSIRFTDIGNNENFAVFYDDGAVELYFNGSNVFQTTATGINVTGTAVTDGVTVDGTLDIEEVFEKVTTATSTTGTISYSTVEQGIAYFTANQTANRTINFTNVNSNLAVGQSVTCSVLMAQGSTAYYLNGYQVDGTTVTPKWSGGSTPTGGNASGIDVYTFTIIKTADATFTVLASQSQYA